MRLRLYAVVIHFARAWIRHCRKAATGQINMAIEGMHGILNTIQFQRLGPEK